MYCNSNHYLKSQICNKCSKIGVSFQMLVCTNAGIGAKAINIKCITILYKLSYFEVFIAANSAPRAHRFTFSGLWGNLEDRVFTDQFCLQSGSGLLRTLSFIIDRNLTTPFHLKFNRKDKGLNNTNELIKFTCSINKTKSKTCYIEQFHTVFGVIFQRL